MAPQSNVKDRRQVVSLFTKILTTATFFLICVYATYEMRIRTALTGFDERVKLSVDSLRYPENPNILIHTTYTGIQSLDYGLRFLVTAFLPGGTGFHDPAALVLSAYFLMSFFTLLAVYNVEAGRSGAKGYAFRLTSLWAVFYQTVGGAIVLAILHLLLVRQYWNPNYYSATNKLPRPYAKALLPSLVLGYLLPTIAVYLPFSDPDWVLKQKLVAFWQITPFVVNILLLVLGILFASAGGPREGDAYQSVQTDLNRIYAVSFTVSTLSHFGMLYAWRAWDLSFVRIFVPQVYMLEHGVADPLHYVFQIDYLVIFGSGLLMAFLALWFLNNSGKVPFNAFQVLLAISVGTVVVGPAATIAAAYWVRDIPLGRTRSGKKRN